MQARIKLTIHVCMTHQTRTQSHFLARQKMSALLGKIAAHFPDMGLVVDRIRLVCMENVIAIASSVRYLVVIILHKVHRIGFLRRGY